jgi:hypothetical protein
MGYTFVLELFWPIDMLNSVFRFWLQWLCILLIIIAWLLIIFVLNVPNCPKGYLDPGGKHEHRKYQNCTGGKLRSAITLEIYSTYCNCIYF